MNERFAKHVITINYATNTLGLICGTTIYVYAQHWKDMIGIVLLGKRTR